MGLQDRRAVREVSASAGGRKPTRPLTQASPYQFARTSRHITSPLLDEDMLPVFDDEDGLAPELHHVTWQKVVETPSRPPAVHPPRPPLPPQSHPILQYIPYGCARLLPRVMFWLSMIVVVVLVTAGAFGVIGALGRSRTASTPGATLQVNPDEVAVGGTMTVRGSGFSPRAQIGLTRDAAIPVADTNGTTIISSDKDGNFTDTLIVGPDWINGTHTISVEDSVTHRFTSTPMQVTGMGDLQRPAHLRLSVTSLDLGAGDPALNSTQKVELTNLGGGQISWSAKATQSWLTISPKSGTFSSGMMAEVTIAANRAHLSPGSFSDQLLFSSSAGDTVLPVKMSVTALQVQGEAVLQVAPAALSFTARDAGPAPDAQGVAISNPGQSQLHWTAVANAPWLKLSAQEGTIEPSASGSTGVSVDSAKLLPGTYNGTITFSASGTDGVMHSTQSVAVSVTITPGCALAASPNMLTFTAAYQQSGPDAKMLDLSTTNCLSSTAWRASSSASWLTVSQTSGSTPARPAIGVNMAGLQPGTYNGSVMFSSAAGTQQVAVKFILSQPARPALGVGTTGRLNFGGVAGQEDTTTRSITLSNTGSGTLHWSARATTGGNGDWLSLSPGSGSIGAHQSATLTATAQTLADMAPGTYSGVISITATDGQGQEVAGSPQSIAVSKVVSVGCTVVTTPSALTFNAQAGSGSASQDFSVGVAGSCKGSVTVTPSAEANWLSVSPSQATATPGSAANFTVAASASKLAAGQYTGSIALAVNGPTTGDGPGSVGVTLHVTSTTPAVTHSLEVNNSALAFSTTAGHNPAAQSVTISNSNQSAVNWRATTSQAWLAVSPGHGLTAPSGSSTLMVSVDATGLAAKMYTATLTLTPSGGQALVVKVTLKVSSAAPTPAVTPDPTPLPTPTPQLQPTVVAAPTPQATATPLSEPPTPVGISSGPPSPVKTVLPSPNPVPVPTPRPQPTATPYSARPTPTPQAQPTPTVAVQPTSTTAAQLTPTAIAQTYPPAKHIDTSPSPTPTPPPRPILTPTPRPEIRPTPVNEVAPTQRPLIRPTPIPVNNPIPAQRPVIRVTPTPVYNAIPTQRSEIRPTPTAITRTYPPVKHIDAYPSPTPPPRAVPTPRSVVRPTPVNNVVPTRRPVQILTPTPTPEAEIVPTQRPVPSITPTPEAMLTPSGSQHDHKHGGA